MSLNLPLEIKKLQQIAPLQFIIFMRKPLCSTAKAKAARGRGWGFYLAIFTALSSRITVTLIWPGYCISF